MIVGIEDDDGPGMRDIVLVVVGVWCCSLVWCYGTRYVCIGESDLITCPSCLCRTSPGI
jgi:hypothetical protein